MKRLSIVLALVLLATSLAAAADSRTGVWSAQLDGDAVHVNLVRPSRDGHLGQNNFGTNLPLASLSGLTKADVNAPAANVQFSFTAPAGTIAFEGRFSNGLGAGNFRFTENDAFVREMQSLGYGELKDDMLLVFAVESFRPQTIRDLRALGYTIEKRQIDDVAIFKIDANFVKEITALGFANPTFRELVNLRIGHVDAAFVRNMREIFPDVSARDVAEMGILHVTPEYVRELQRAGLTSLTPRQATNLHIFKVTPKFIEEQRARGETNITPQKLIDMKIFSRREARKK